MNKEEMLEFGEIVASAVVTALEKKLPAIEKAAPRPPKDKKTAYKKTEQLLYNYLGFKRIVEDRMQEIEEVKKYGVPKGGNPFAERVQGGSLPSGIITTEESVESAVQRLEFSIKGTVAAIALIDKAMWYIQGDPYYKIVEMRYFEGRTQEDIALEFGVSQVNVSYHNSRLVKSIALQIFPDQCIEEIMK